MAARNKPPEPSSKPPEIPVAGKKASMLATETALAIVEAMDLKQCNTPVQIEWIALQIDAALALAPKSSDPEMSQAFHFVGDETNIEPCDLAHDIFSKLLECFLRTSGRATPTGFIEISDEAIAALTNQAHDIATRYLESVRLWKKRQPAEKNGQDN